MVASPGSDYRGCHYEGASYRKMSEQWCWKLKISGDARGSGRTVFLLDDGSAVDVAHDIEVDSSDREVVAVTRFPESKRPLPIFGNTDPVYIGESWDIEEPAVAAVKKAYACIASAVAAYELGGAVTFGREQFGRFRSVSRCLQISNVVLAAVI